MIVELANELKRAGYDVDNVIADGRWHRFKGDSRDRKKSGAYIAFQNYSQETGAQFYVMLYGSWSTHEEGAWSKHCTIADSAMTPHDRARMQEQMRRARQKADEERKRDHEDVARNSLAVWNAISDLGEVAPYLAKKGLDRSFGARYSESYEYGRCAVVPLHDTDGRLWNLQRLQPDGGKFFEPGGRKQGCFHIIGAKSSGDIHGRIYIAEGFATAASVHLATGEPCVVAFDAGNLASVAKALKAKHQEKQIVICGDDDRGKEKNKGRDSAEAAASLCGGVAVFPVFPEGAKGKDFDDLRQLSGTEEVQSQILGETALAEVTESGIDANFVMNFPYPDENPKTLAKKDTPENIEELLRRLRVVARYNVISKQEEFLIPGESFTRDNRANATLGWITGWCCRVGLPTGNLQTYLTMLAERNQYSPVVNWIKHAEWDGTPRLAAFCDTIHAVDEETKPEVYSLKHTLMRRWMVSAVAGAFLPDGVSAHGVLVLQGVQYSGKTQWFKRLAPRELRVLKDGITLDPKDKDSVFQAVSHWIVELGELDATFKRADIAQLKAFITKDGDLLRRPFARKESDYARRTVFFASVNEPAFLKDPTGNRRFWTVPCDRIQFDHEFDMQQVWAEVYELFKKGESWFLTREEMLALNTSNEDFTEIDPFEEQIRHAYEWSCPRVLKKTASEVCKDLGIFAPNKHDVNACATALRKVTGTAGNRTKNGKFYDMPRLKSSMELNG